MCLPISRAPCAFAGVTPVLGPASPKSPALPPNEVSPPADAPASPSMQLDQFAARSIARHGPCSSGGGLELVSRLTPVCFTAEPPVLGHLHTCLPGTPAAPCSRTRSRRTATSPPGYVLTMMCSMPFVEIGSAHISGAVGPHAPTQCARKLFTPPPPGLHPALKLVLVPIEGEGAQQNDSSASSRGAGFGRRG